jgi:hypothetical protein
MDLRIPAKKYISYISFISRHRSLLHEISRRQRVFLTPVVATLDVLEEIEEARVRAANLFGSSHHGTKTVIEVVSRYILL